MRHQVHRVCPRTTNRTARDLFVVVVLGVAVVACRRQTATEQEPTQTQQAQGTVGAESREAAGQSAPAPSAIRESHFELKASSQGPHTVGTTESLDIVLEALGGYKVNQEYPYKFKLRPAAGVTFPMPIVKKDRVKLDKRRATMTVPFTPTATGARRIGGEFAFSVCTDEKCLIEKRELSFLFEAESP